jgi:YABBY protein
MKTELPKVKAANPNLSHREAFKVAAGNWKSAPENPINKK